MLHVVVFCLEIFREMRTSLISVSELVFSLDKQREKKGCLRCKLNRCHFACKTKFTENDVKIVQVEVIFFVLLRKFSEKMRLSFMSVSGIFLILFFGPEPFFLFSYAIKSIQYSVHEKYLCTCISLYDISCLFLCDFKSMFIVVFDDLINICNM